MKKLLVVVLGLVLSSCSISMGAAEKDACCLEVCNSYFDDVHFALWQGDDSLLKFTRCGCFVYPNDYEMNCITPLKTCESEVK